MTLLKSKRAPLVPIGNLYEKTGQSGAYYSGQLVINGMKIGVLIMPSRADVSPDRNGSLPAFTLLADADELDMFEKLAQQRITDHPF